MSHVKKRKRTNGAVFWEAVVTDPAHPRGEWSQSFDFKKEADAFIKEKDTERTKGTFVSPIHGKVLFQPRYDVWAEGRVQRDSTHEIQETYARSLILPTFGLMPIADITHDVIQAWIADLIDGAYAASTIHKAHGVLSKVLAKSVAQGLLPSNPCDHSELPRVETEEMRFLDADQVAHLASVIDPRYMPFVLLGAYGGLRAGEIFGLRVARIDFMRHEIDVAENLVLVRNQLRFHKPKTRAGKRRVPIPPFVSEILAEYVYGKDPMDLVFTTPGRKDGTGVGRGSAEPMRLNNFRKRIWYPATLDAGFATMNQCPGEGCTKCKRRPGAPTPARRPAHYEGLRIHDLRHTAVSLWIAMGANQLEVARRAGHVSVSTVYDRYGHLFPRDEDPTIAKLDAMGRAAMEKLRRPAAVHQLHP